MQLDLDTAVKLRLVDILVLVEQFQVNQLVKLLLLLLLLLTLSASNLARSDAVFPVETEAGRVDVGDVGVEGAVEGVGEC